jgi:hypothetical protein
MTPPHLNRSHEPDLISRIGGAAQGGSAKTPQERKALDREHEEKQKDRDEPAGASDEVPQTAGEKEDRRQDGTGSGGASR